MHPLVARIHPSLRTAFFAWFLSRAAMYGVMQATGRDVFLTPSTELGLGGLWLSAVELLNERVHSLENAGTWLNLGLGELALFMGAIFVYRFVRRDGLPHVAERATWLWAFSPLMAFVTPGSIWCLAIPAALGALELTSGGRHGWGALLGAIAIGLRPEAVLLIPGLTALGWKHKTDEFGPWLSFGVPVLAFSLTVLGTIFFGDSARALYESGGWRADWTLAGFTQPYSDLAVLLGVLAGLVLVVMHRQRLPKSWLLVTIPLLLWPILQEPSTAMAAPLLFGAPIFAHLGLVTEDPSIERPILLGSVLGLVFVLLMM